MDAMQKMLEMAKKQLLKQFDECSIPVVCAVGQSGETMVPMDDGVRLRTIYWKPKEKSSFPVILLRSCYPNQEPIMIVKAEEVCKRGFGVVLQWCRGTGGSEGEWEPNIYDRADGLATMRWLDQMDEVESIGYWGDSYLAYTAGVWPTPSRTNAKPCISVFTAVTAMSLLIRTGCSVRTS